MTQKLIDEMLWKVDTKNLLQEVVGNNEILLRPIQIFSSLLYKIAERASEINDGKLNDFMLRLNLYEQKADSARSTLSQPDIAERMAREYETERAKYVGGVVYYPDNGAAHTGCMMKALAAYEAAKQPPTSETENE